MAYYSGSANDMAALHAALVNACVSEGWAWDSSTEMLSKGVLFLRLQVVSGYLTLLGRTSAAAGDMPNVVRVGQIGSVAVTWPVAYEVFVFDDEVYLVINYSVDYYQWAAFGRSVLGQPGTGMYVAASLGSTAADSSIAMGVTAGGSGLPATTGAIFWEVNAAPTSNRTAWVMSDLDGQGWWLNTTLTGPKLGPAPIAPLISLLPNSWNSEAVLLPIRAYKIRKESKISMVADLANARYTRVDNYSPGQVISLGDDRWKIFPFYRKNSVDRNGVPAGGVDHTGTLGWAIRYEGP